MKKIRITRKQFRIILFAYRIGGFLLVSGLLIGFSFLIGKPFEFIILFLSYFSTKGLYKSQYHTDSMKNCLLLSFFIFGILIIAIIPKEISISMSVFLGILTPLISYKCGIIKTKLKDYEYIEPRYNFLLDFYRQQTDVKPFNVDCCSKSELLQRCMELHFNKENTELAIMFFIDKTKHSIIADMLCIDEKSVTMRKRRMKNKLNGK